MELLEQALAKARSERSRRASSADSAQSKRGQSTLSPIFSITRVAPADWDLMAEEHIVANRLEARDAGLYRTMRSRVLQWLAKNGKRTVAVTSIGEGEGRTLTAANLALAISMDVNQTALLVDADLRAPSVHKRFGIEVEFGLDDYLGGRAPVEKCLVNPGIERLVLLPSKTPRANSAELLASPRMVALTKELRDRYRDRVIIYDAPSLFSQGDALGFLPHIESVLLVVRDGCVRADEIKRAMEVMKDCTVLGTVLNGVV